MPEAVPSTGPVRVSTASSTPITAKTNNDNASPADLQKRRSLTAASTARPPNSPQSSTPKRSSSQHRVAPSPSTTAPQGGLLRRSSSSLSINRRASTPTLTKRSSMTSLQGTTVVTSPRSPQRRSSTHFTSSPSPLVERIDEGSEQIPPPTAATVASAYFQRELDMHSWTEEAAPPKGSKAIVILHDSCYGHRYSRPRTSKASLNSIVERPERLLASILGVAAAYVRLGGRHADGKFPPQPKFTPQSMDDFPFRIHKTTRSVSLTSPTVTNVHGLKWMEELKVMCDHAEAKLAMNGKELVRPEAKGTGPDKEEKPKFHEGDLYLCSDTLEALEGAVGAVCEGVDRVFSTPGPSKAFICIRPPGHHCSSSYPSGFCWINNVNIGISHASMSHGLTHAAIIDFDLHHGDGSQAITWAHNARTVGLPKNAASSKRPSIGYFSLHDINSYPCEMGDEEKIRNASLCIENAHGQTIWNVHLQPWKDETEFWKLYESRYTVLIDKARDFLRAHTERINTSTNQLQPKAAIFLSSGFDASQWESPGMQRHKVNVPTEFYARFTRDVAKLSEEDGTGVNGRVISVLEGGYSDRALCSGVLSHLSGLIGGDPVPEFQDIGLRAEMSKRLGTINAYEGNGDFSESPSKAPYNPDWWALPQLMELESLVNPPPPPPAPKKPRNPTPPTYTTPTQSFTAKIISSPKVRRSVSGPGSASPRVTLSRPPSPIYPDVGWATAAHELSKLLIPTERQTKSWRPEDLSAEAQRIKRERHSVVGLPDAQAGDGTRRSLRERKIRAPTPAVEEEEDDVTIKRENRRNTFAGAELIPEKVSRRGPTSAGSGPLPIRQSGRRISVSSNAGPADSDMLKQANSDSSKPQLLNGPSSRMSSRSGSTTSIRAGSSMSIRGEGNGGLVKKSRIPGQTKIEPPKPRGTKKQPLLSHPTVPSSQEAMTATSHQPTTSGPSAASDPSGPGRPKSEDDTELDNLASRVKKITLHVPSREEHDMRERKRLEDKKGTPKPLRKTTAPKASKIATIKDSEAKEPVSDTILIAPNNANASTGTPLSTTFGAVARPSETSPLQNAPVQTEAPTNGNSNVSNVQFIPYAEDVPRVHSYTPKAPLVWMPVNQNTPPPARKGELPVFTATSPITFAKAGAQVSLGSKLRPRDTVQGPEEDNVLREGSGESRILGVENGNRGINGNEAGADIWDVPVTPKH